MAFVLTDKLHELPAIAGGSPVFPEGLPLARPRVSDKDAVLKAVDKILSSGALTNGTHVRTLEDKAADYLGVTHCVAVASCTSGLMLVLKAMGLSGDVVLPSFTFAATAHAAVWNELRPVFADIDPGSLTLDPASAGHAVGIRTSAILATHTFGTPADVAGLSDLARRNGLRLIFDAAHAFGSLHGQRPIGGFGDAEVFSLSPTKVLVAAEGGIIATNDDLLAERCRIGRDYGNPGDYDCVFVGLNARMSEVHAAIALASFEDLEERIERRNGLAALYRQALAGVPGIEFPTVPEGSRSTFKDLAILVDRHTFGGGPDMVAEALAAEGIDTRRYFAPPVHQMRAYRTLASVNGSLPVTEHVSARVLTLPLWVGMTDSDVQRVKEAIVRIHSYLSGGTRENSPAEEEKRYDDHGASRGGPVPMVGLRTSVQEGSNP